VPPYNILVTEQYSFKNKSFIKASHKLIDEILSALNNKTLVDGICCDLKKASDCINYILLSKLGFYGTVDKTNALVKSYLTETREL
jgi:hypothetical protein